MRQPGIHINEAQLEQVLQKLLNRGDSPIEYDCKTFARNIVEASKGLTLTRRSVLVTNEKLKRVTDKVNAAGRDSTAVFVSIVHLLRRQMKHRGLIAPKPGSTEWLSYKEITALATEFCNEFGFQRKEGFTQYARIGLSKMKNFSIFKFKQLHEAIFKEYEALESIRTDRNERYTKQAHDYFGKLISERIGYFQGYEKDPIKYACFIDAVKTAQEFGIDPRTYIKAQFAGFDWRSGIPDPLQLNGLKAVERLQAYCFENQIKLGKENQNKGKKDFEKIKRAGQ